MEDEADNANNNITEQEESISSVLSPLLSSTKMNKRLRSRVWDDFIPTFVDKKVVQAECMHCRRVFNSCGTNGTSSMLRHLDKCSTGILKKPRQQEHMALPSTKKCMAAAGSDLKQKKLPFLPSSQIKCIGAADAAAAQKDLAPLQDTPMNMNRNNHVDQNTSGEEVAKSEHLALPDVSADKNRKNQCHEETASPKQRDLPNETSQKNQEVDQNGLREEVTEILAMHGHLPGMMDQDGFRKLVAWLNPMVNVPSHNDLMAKTHDLFQKERSKLKEKLAALLSRICLSVNMWYYEPTLAFLCLTVHYIDDEWEKQEKVIVFRAVGSSCNAKEMSDIILGAIGEWCLDGKIFSIMLDDAFIDDSVALSLKVNLQERNPLAANRSLFVVRSAAHLLDRVIQVGLDEFDRVMEKLTKFPNHTKGPNPSAVHCPNYRYAPSREVWRSANMISETLDDLHKYVELMHILPKPANIFDNLWDAKREFIVKLSTGIMTHI
ncbi:hypothetical protein QOZ80_6BG0487180 [Eleusine coracana subsp. coracana]|nr:hypothetical protein QOZ80_6BG0487180 [Eleusine coracana subsp. coracana]